MQWSKLSVSKRRSSKLILQLKRANKYDSFQETVIERLYGVKIYTLMQLVLCLGSSRGNVLHKL
jgi:hypothetical protein